MTFSLFVPLNDKVECNVWKRVQHLVNVFVDNTPQRVDGRWLRMEFSGRWEYVFVFKYTHYPR